MAHYAGMMAGYLRHKHPEAWKTFRQVALEVGQAWLTPEDIEGFDGSGRSTAAMKPAKAENARLMQANCTAEDWLKAKASQFIQMTAAKMPDDAPAKTARIRMAA